MPLTVPQPELGPESRRWALVLFVCLVGAGCSPGASTENSVTPVVPTSVAATKTTMPNATTVVTLIPVVCGPLEESTPSVFDDSAGTYPAYILGLLDGQPEFDIVQWLTGQDAIDAYADLGIGDGGGPPDGYLIVNVNDKRRMAPLAANASVGLLDPDGGGQLRASSAEGLRELVRSDGTAPPLVWLTFDNGTIVSVCEHPRT